MGKLIAIGEALIDMIPEETGKGIKDICGFKPIVGGAPANVCGAFSKLGGESKLITQLGNDPFGDKIVEAFSGYNISCEYVKRTNKANTALAFVSLKEDGNREFSFYRNPSADMLLEPEEIKEEWFTDCSILHFCSVALASEPMRLAHERAIEYASKNKALVSFDPNLRFALWENLEDLRKTVLEFIPKADILKISDEELAFINGDENADNYSEEDIKEAIRRLFVGNVELIIYTKGSEGAEAYTLMNYAFAPSKKVKAVDTTGAGDGFIGSFLYQLYRDGVNKNNISELSSETLEKYLAASNDFCGKSVMASGAIASYPKEI